MKIYQQIASLINAIETCQRTGNAWEFKHKDTLRALVKEYMPSGSGFDSGTKLLEESTPNKLMFKADFHHMDENGMYDGWSTHTITVKPSLQFDFVLSVSGEDRDGIKAFIEEAFDAALIDEYTPKAQAAQ